MKRLLCWLFGHKWGLNRNNIPDYTYEQYCMREKKWITCDYLTKKPIKGGL